MELLAHRQARGPEPPVQTTVPLLPPVPTPGPRQRRPASPAVQVFVSRRSGAGPGRRSPGTDRRPERPRLSGAFTGHMRSSLAGQHGARVRPGRSAISA